jgi:hypothetical protein
VRDARQGVIDPTARLDRTDWDAVRNRERARHDVVAIGHRDELKPHVTGRDNQIARGTVRTRDRADWEARSRRAWTGLPRVGARAGDGYFRVGQSGGVG